MLTNPQTEKEKILVNEIKRIFRYYSWNQKSIKMFEEKINSEDKEVLYVLNKEYIDNWKSKIEYEKLQTKLSQKGKNLNESDISKILDEEKINFDINNLGKMKIISLVKNCEKGKINKNPKIDKEEMKKIELVNKEVYESFKEIEKDGEIEVECLLKDGKYILAELIKIDRQNVKEITNNKENKNEETKETDNIEENQNEEKVLKELKKDENVNQITEQNNEIKKEENLKLPNEKVKKKDDKYDKKEENNENQKDGENKDIKMIEDKKDVKTGEQNIKEKEIDKNVVKIKEKERDEKNENKIKEKDSQNHLELNDNENCKLVLNKKRKKSQEENCEKKEIEKKDQILEENQNRIIESINHNNANEVNNNQINNYNREINLNNQEQNNNIDFEEIQMKFQMMVQNYLKEHGFANNFINFYLSISQFEPANDEEKEMIKYLRTKLNNYQPNIINGLIILNTQSPSLGLQNVGATCYMNATLQCLIHIRELSELLLSAFYMKKPEEDPDFIKNHQLSYEYVNILKQVFFPKFYGNNDMKSFAPYKFKELVGQLNPLFSGINANDAKDLLQFILERMHSETKMAMQYFQEYIIDQSNELQAKQYFYNSYVYQSNSPFLIYLYGIIKIQTQCCKCKTIKYNFQSYNLLYFPLKESKNHIVTLKKSKDSNFNEKDYVLTLEDCFEFNQKVEHFSGDNCMYCNICKDLQEADYQSMLYSTPPVLSIVLNRGRANLDFQEKFTFGPELNIEKYLHNEEKKGKYYLIGIVVHLGESNMSGHFMAFRRMDRESKWFCYNDSFVEECKDLNEIIKHGTPYILFYHQE